MNKLYIVCFTVILLATSYSKVVFSGEYEAIKLDNISFQRYEYFTRFAPTYAEILSKYVAQEQFEELKELIFSAKEYIDLFLTNPARSQTKGEFRCAQLLKKIIEKKEQALKHLSYSERARFRNEAINLFSPVKLEIDSKNMAKNKRWHQSEQRLKNEVISENPKNRHMVVTKINSGVNITHVITGFSRKGSTFDSYMCAQDFFVTAPRFDEEPETIEALLTSEGILELVRGKFVPLLVADNSIFRVAKMCAGEKHDGKFVCKQDITNAIEFPLFGKPNSQVQLLTKVLKFSIEEKSHDQIMISFAKLPTGLGSTELEHLLTVPVIKNILRVFHPGDDVMIQRQTDEKFQRYIETSDKQSVYSFLTETGFGNCQMTALAGLEIVPEIVMQNYKLNYHAFLAVGYYVNLQGDDIIDFNANNHMWSVFAQQESTGALFSLDLTGKSLVQIIPNSSFGHRPDDDSFFGGCEMAMLP